MKSNRSSRLRERSRKISSIRQRRRPPRRKNKNQLCSEALGVDLPDDDIGDISIDEEDARNETSTPIPRKLTRCERNSDQPNAIGVKAFSTVLVSVRCVKCGKPHLTRDCTKKREEDPTCCHCQGNHPANFPPPPKVNFWEERARKKKEMLDAAKEKSEQAKRAQNEAPVQAQETSSSRKIKRRPRHPQKSTKQGILPRQYNILSYMQSSGKTLDHLPKPFLLIGSLLTSKRSGSL
ncbi:hypothetical protein TNCV_236921 [Trichonephila clavipes]|nr:hypothetical protein TNCV_236921 [Trichonephila clavipes]